MPAVMNFAELSQFYRNFAELDQAGINYAKVFESLKKNERNSERQRQLQFIAEHLKKGRLLSEAFKFLKFVPVFDIPLIRSAEEMGRLVDVFKMLAKKYMEAHLAERSIRGQMLKPYLTLAVALFVPSIPDLFLQKVTLAHYLKGSLLPLILITGIFGGLYHLWKKSFYDLSMAEMQHGLLSAIPFFSGLSRLIALEKFSNSFSMMQESGMDLFQSLEQSAAGSASPTIKQAVRRLIPLVRNGVTITSAFQGEKDFPSELVTAIDLGLQAGKLPEFLRRYSGGLRADIDRKQQFLVRAVPVVMYWLVTAYVAYTIIGFYRGHLNDINKVLSE